MEQRPNHRSLAEVDWHIEIARMLVESQRGRVEFLKRSHLDTSQAERQLRHYIASLQLIRLQREKLTSRNHDCAPRGTEGR